MTVSLNTLFVTLEGARLHKEQATVVVSHEGEKELQVPLLHLQAISCLARVTVTPELMAECAEAGIAISYFGYGGRFLARVEGIPGGNVLLRREQHRAADDARRTLAIARAIVTGKVVNERRHLLHAARDGGGEDLSAGAHELGGLVSLIERADSIEQVRGLEGAAARAYFARFPALLKRPDLSFESRERRPPTDPVNALLSFGYALLMSDCAGALASIGLDPAVGYLHEDRPGRLGLALDLMEELRTPLVDRWALAQFNRRQLDPSDFTVQGSGAVLLSDAARKRALVAYQEAKQVEIQHPFLGISVPWGRVPHLQALLLARHLRGDLDAYPPFTLR